MSNVISAHSAHSAPTEMVAKKATPEVVMEVMGGKGQWGSVGWLVIQEQAAGRRIEDIARFLECEVADLEAVRDSVTGCTGEESEAIWAMGIVALKTEAALNQRVIDSGWDAIEAMAVEKLSRSLVAMQTNGDPMQMLTIAEKANKAMRRSEGMSRVPGHGATQRVIAGAPRPGEENGVGGGDTLSVELHSGNLGTLQFNFSPKIRQQLQNPSRVIDAVTKDVEETRKKMGIKNLEMLKLEETRGLLDQPRESQEPSKLDPEEKPFNLESLAGITGE